MCYCSSVRFSLLCVFFSYFPSFIIIFRNLFQWDLLVSVSLVFCIAAYYSHRQMLLDLVVTRQCSRLVPHTLTHTQSPRHTWFMRVIVGIGIHNIKSTSTLYTADGRENGKIGRYSALSQCTLTRIKSKESEKSVFEMKQEKKCTILSRDEWMWMETGKKQIGEWRCAFHSWTETQKIGRFPCTNIIFLSAGRWLLPSSAAFSSPTTKLARSRSWHCVYTV